MDILTENLIKVGIAVLVGALLVSLLCAHFVFRWGLNRRSDCEKLPAAAPVE